jgi:hypothetical protein
MCVKLDNKWLSRETISSGLLTIAEDSSGRPLKPRNESVSLLTSDDRRNWAKAREILKKGKKNFEILKAIVAYFLFL